MLKKNILVILSTWLVALSGIYTDTKAGLNEWTSHGPYGGNVRTLLVDPSNRQIVYVGTEYGGVWKTTDGGESWVPINKGLSGKSVYALALDPSDSQVIYAGASGISKSTDGGANWTAMNTGLPSSPSALSLAIDPSDSRVMYAGIQGWEDGAQKQGVFKSTDEGATWIASGLSGIRVVSLAVNPSNTQIIYAGTEYAGIFKSTDGGATWTEINTGLPMRASIYVLVFDAANSEVIYAGGSEGIFKSTDGGAHWSVLTNGLPDEVHVRALAVDPSDRGVLYAGGGTGGRFLGTMWEPNVGGIFKSTDGGTSWAAINLTDVDVYAMAIDPSEDHILYAGTNGEGIWKSVDRGANWRTINQGFSSHWITTVVFDPLESQVLYAGTRGGGAFKSTDGGTTWTPINNGLPVQGFRRDVGALIFHPSERHVLYAGMWGGVFKSSDGGGTWMDANTGLPGNVSVSALAFDPSDNQIVYAGDYLKGIFKSVDGGRTWMPTGIADIGVTTLAIDPTDSKRIYAGTFGRGLLKSTDGGRSWITDKTLSNITVYRLAMDPTDSQVIYAGTFGKGLFKSTDGGQTWRAINSDVSKKSIYALAIYPFDPQILYADWGEGIFKSTDGGQTWRANTTGMPPDVRADVFAFDPTHSQIVYVGTLGGGVFQMQDTSLPLVTTAIEETTTLGSSLPVQFALRQNVPNPFNASTMIRYELPSESPIRLVVYDLLGRKVRVLVDRMEKPGSYHLIWDGRDDTGREVGTGLYVVQMTAEGLVQVRKMCLIR